MPPDRYTTPVHSHVGKVRDPWFLKVSTPKIVRHGDAAGAITVCPLLRFEE